MQMVFDLLKKNGRIAVLMKGIISRWGILSAKCFGLPLILRTNLKLKGGENLLIDLKVTYLSIGKIIQSGMKSMQCGVNYTRLL